MMHVISVIQITAAFNCFASFLLGCDGACLGILAIFSQPPVISRPSSDWQHKFPTLSCQRLCVGALGALTQYVFVCRHRRSSAKERRQLRVRGSRLSKMPQPLAVRLRHCRRKYTRQRASWKLPEHSSPRYEIWQCPFCQKLLMLEA